MLASLSSRQSSVGSRSRTSASPIARVAMAMTIAVSLTLPAYCHAQADVEDDNLAQPTIQNNLTSRLVAQMMERIHLSKLPLDDKIADRAFDQYIKSLDPLKDYFLQSDIDEFKIRKNNIDDKFRKGEFDIALQVFRRFLQRVDQRTELAMQMIDTPHDFTAEEKLVTDPDLQSFATTNSEVAEKWRKRIKYSLLVLQVSDDEAKKKKENEAAAKKDELADGSGNSSQPKPKLKKEPDPPQVVLRKRYQAINRRMHQMDTEDVIERYISAVTSSFDPHTSYMSGKTYENFIIAMGLQLEGIGATLQGTDDGYTTIRAIVKGGAAGKHGELKVEDKIYAVAQGDENGGRLDPDLARKHGVEFVDVTGMRLDDVVAMIRGKAGTTVRLSVLSENDAELHTVSIVREKIKLEDQAAKGQVFEENGKKIGVIDLPSFYADLSNNGGGRSTTRDVRKILVRFNRENVDGLIVDLRLNGGGSLPEAVNLTGLFIDLGPVVQIKNPTGRIEKLDDEDRGMAWNKPMVVLTSKYSASASEILAGAIQDYGRGLVVGDTTTHGKGTVQSLRNLTEILTRIPNAPCEHGALKITTAQFYRPNGDSTQKRGVLSDIVLPSISDNKDGIAEADLDYPVEFDRVPSARFNKLSLVDASTISQLKAKSSGRLQQSEDFRKLTETIGKYVEQNRRKSVTLNMEKFLARREELKADDDQDSEDESKDDDNSIERTFYLDEVIKITTDYMDLLSSQGRTVAAGSSSIGG